MAIEIVDLPIKNGGSFHSYVTVYQRVVLKCLEYMDDYRWTLEFLKGLIIPSFAADHHVHFWNSESSCGVTHPPLQVCSAERNCRHILPQATGCWHLKTSARVSYKLCRKKWKCNNITSGFPKNGGLKRSVLKDASIIDWRQRLNACKKIQSKRYHKCAIPGLVLSFSLIPFKFGCPDHVCVIYWYGLCIVQEESKGRIIAVNWAACLQV